MLRHMGWSLSGHQLFTVAIEYLKKKIKGLGSWLSGKAIAIQA